MRSFLQRTAKIAYIYIMSTAAAIVLGTNAIRIDYKTMQNLSRICPDRSNSTVKRHIE